MMTINCAAITIENPLWQNASRLIRQVSKANLVSLTPLQGGRNNRVYKADTDEQPLLLKSYFQHPQDQRDRLRTEFEFARFAWRQHCRQIAQPIACDSEQHLALFSYIDGHKPDVSQLAGKQCDAAIDFIKQLNQYRNNEAAIALPNASEACLSYRQHMDTVDRRLQRFKRLDVNDDMRAQALALIQQQVQPLFAQLQKNIHQPLYDAHLAGQSITAEDLLLSPSDFGFHNAILNEQGQLFFIDFEYAGWDDPAKLICDFLCQPEIPLPRQFHSQFVNGILALCSNAEQVMRRVKWFLPVHHLKWCLIMLNDFLPVDSDRRNFSVSDSEQRQRQSDQLERVRHYLHNHHLHNHYLHNHDLYSNILPE